MSHADTYRCHTLGGDLRAGLVCLVLLACATGTSVADPNHRFDSRKPLFRAQTLPLHDAPDGMQRLATAIVLDNLPETYEDTRKWGMTRRRIDGLHMRMDGLKLRTKRKWKHVNHGTWKRFRITQVQPEKNLKVVLGDPTTLADGRAAFRVELESTINGIARLAEWNRGVRLISVTLDVNAEVKIAIDCRLRVQLDPSRLPPDVVLEPEIVDARLMISKFKINRISHFDGPIVHELSGNLRKLIEQKIDEKRPRLVAKINRQITRHQDDLRISMHDVLKEKWQNLTKPAASSAASPAGGPTKLTKGAD